MFGLSIIKTRDLLSLQRQVEEKNQTIELYTEIVSKLRKDVARLTQKRSANGRFVKND